MMKRRQQSQESGPRTFSDWMLVHDLRRTIVNTDRHEVTHTHHVTSLHYGDATTCPKCKKDKAPGDTSSANRLSSTAWAIMIGLAIVTAFAVWARMGFPLPW